MSALNLSLPPEVLALVLLAAAMHAGWNALVKISGDRLMTQAVIIATGSLVCAALIPFFGLPGTGSWKFILLGALLHNLYYALLLRAYSLGDLSQVYPIARGVAPLLIAVAAGPVVGEALSLPSFAGILLVTGGIVLLAWGRSRRADGRAIFYSLATGLLIAAYSLVDGLGVRRAESSAAFICWLQACEMVPIGLFVLLRRRDRLAPFLRLGGGRAAVGGLMATAAYAIVLWAYSRASLAPVAALRETSVVMAALIGAISLGEPFGGVRVIAASIVVAGVALINLS